MQSLLLLGVVICLLAVPGIAASLAVFRPGEASLVTRLAAAFGLGYAVCGGAAFVLAAAHAFRLSLFLLVWLVASAALWAAALRRAPFREHLHALGEDLRENRLPLILGALAIAALMVLHLRFLHLLGGSRYIYYLNGIQIANSGGVPASVLNYGQSWPPTTDKIVLDAFTGVVVLIDHNVAVGPGVLLWVSLLGAALGLWASGWELGLRRTSPLLPLLVVNNQVIFKAVSDFNSGPRRSLARVSTDFAEYRAEDFGRAVAFCALALGIHAIRQRRWGTAVSAGVVLAAASATHLIPAAVIALALGCAAAAELLRGDKSGSRPVTLRQTAVIAAVSVACAAIVQLFAGGSLGLGGASTPSGYAAVRTRFDPTAYLFTGRFLRRDPAGTGHWYIPPRRVVADIMAGSGIHWPGLALFLLFAGCLLAAVLLLILVPGDLKTIGVTGAGLLAGLIGVALFFSYHYRVYVDGTFGVRRLPDFSSLGLALLALGVLEALLLYLGRRQAVLSAVAAAALIVAVSVWVLPASGRPQQLGRVSQARITLVDWLRLHTPCNARFLVNQRTEGTLTALTGRFGLLEGMGPFLRVDKLPYAIHLFLGARRFFQAPLSGQAFLRQYGISYVVVARRYQLLGYGGPTGAANKRQLANAPFLSPVLANRAVVVYQVRGAHPPPVSPLLQGPYLHCDTGPVHF